MIQDALSFATCFELNNDPKNVQVTDDTNYAGEGIALSDVEGFFTMTGPDNIVFHNGVISPPDIDADVSLVFSDAVLPIDTNGEVQKGKYTIKYTIVVSGGVQPGTFFITREYNYTYEAVTVQIDLEVDCRCSTITSKDVTNYGTPTTVDRTHTIHPPTGSGLPDKVSSNPQITVTPITDKTWSSEVSSVVTYDFTDGLCVIDTVTGAEENKVECDISLCDIFCCIKVLSDRYFALREDNPFEAANLKRDQLDPVMILVALHDKAITCGQDKLATKFFAQILDISECDPACSCTDDKPTLIVPICGTIGAGGETVVAVCGNGAITLAIGVIGDTTTYTLCFDQALLDRLNELFNTTLLAGSGITITPDIAANGDIEYTIDNTNIESSKSFLRLEIDFTSGLPVFTILDENIIGSVFQAAALDFKNSSDFGAFSKQNNEFEIKNFLVAADQFGQVVEIESLDYIKSSTIRFYTVQATFSITAAGGSIKFQILDYQGLPLSGFALNSIFKKIILVLNINSL